MPSAELAELLSRLSNPGIIADDPFGVARDVANACTNGNYDIESQDLVLRSLDQLDAFGAAKPIVNSLVRECGLFPYLDLEEVGTKELFAAALHRYPKLDSNFILHREQREVLALLIQRKSVVLSAPTSFGKSALIDAVISADLYKNVLILVPTIALMDEVRRRLTKRFSPDWKVITHPGQEKHEKNIYILTPERTDLNELGPLDFFIIDEFYKLGNETEKDRHATLNKVCYRLLQRKIPFFMLGPNIEGIPKELEDRCEFRKTGYKTVAVNVTILDKDPVEETISLCKQLGDSTIVFCRSPERIIEITNGLIAAGVTTENAQAAIAAKWAGENYHPDWHYARAMSHGIGVHHGSIPRSLAHWGVRAFNNRWLNYLLCTTTLIEGVNTRARNLIIVDSKVNRKDISFFTFSNIKGRAGRMMQHFVGNVYSFATSPQEEAPFVDLPIFTQPESTSSSILLGLDPGDLSPASAKRVENLSNNGVLKLSTLKRLGLDPELQIATAKMLLEDPQRWATQFSWSGYPKYDQLKAINGVIWDSMGGKSVSRSGVFSADQLTKFLFDLIRKDLKRMIADFTSDNSPPDMAVQRTNSFMRSWAGFHFPRLFLAIGEIAEEVLGARGFEISSCAPFAIGVERLFYDAGIVALDEYGVPLPLAAKLEHLLAADNSIDGTLQRLRALNIDRLNLHQFERGLLRVARDSIR